MAFPGNGSTSKFKNNARDWSPVPYVISPIRVDIAKNRKRGIAFTGIRDIMMEVLISWVGKPRRGKDAREFRMR